MSQVAESETIETRREFVALMFSLAVAEIGVKAADLVKNGEVGTFLPAYFHLLFALALIAASWVGWSKSRAPGTLTHMDHVFTRTFLILVVDVLIVVEYFVIVRGVDYASVKDQLLSQPNAGVETWGLTIVFFTYAIWDVLARQTPLASVVCLILSGAHGLAFSGETRGVNVILCDCSLISVVFFFRALRLDDNWRSFFTAFRFWRYGTFALTIIFFLIARFL